MVTFAPPILPTAKHALGIDMKISRRYEIGGMAVLIVGGSVPKSFMAESRLLGRCRAANRIDRKPRQFDRI